MIYPNGRYNLNFDVCAICVCAFILLYLVFSENLRVRRIRAFFWVALSILFGSIGELAMDITINPNGITFHKWQAELATFASHVFHNSAAFLLVLYFLSLTGLWHGMSKKQISWLCIPETIMVVLHLIPPVRYQMYHFGAHCTYVRGPLYFVYYVIVAFYVFFGMILLSRNFSSIRKKDQVYVLVLCVGFIGGMIFGICFPYVRATNFIQSLFLVGSFFVLEDDRRLLDSMTGVYNTDGLIRDTYPLFQSGYRSYILSIKLQHLNYYRLMIGMNAMTEVMKQMGAWMLGIAYEDRTFYHVGNGEFAVLLFNTDAGSAKDTALRICERFSKPWTYSGDQTEVTIPAQIWVSSIPDRISSEEQALAFSETSFDDTKPEDHIIVSDEMKDEQRKIDVNVAIRRAITDRTFQVYYQPIYDVQDRKIHSCEALVRMKDPTLGFVSPEEFIKVAEQTGTISRIGEMVFEEVCRFLSEEHPEQYGLDFVEVNLSTIQCMDTNLIKTFQTIMKEYGIDPKQIVLEITESAVIHNEGRMNQVIDDLQTVGFHFALDDFGTGNANLAYIKHFPLQIIKIDKSFLWDAEKDQTDGMILSNMLHLVHDLDLQTVVEGVETEKQRDAMIHDGVNYLQGYFYSKPVPEDEFLRYVRDFNGK